MCVDPRRIRTRLAAFGAAAVLLCWEARAQEPGDRTLSDYLNTLVVERTENWLQREIRTFRTFPHLDRAYRLMVENKLQEARSELERYLEIDPKDLQVRATFMVLRHRMKDYPGVVQQADLVLSTRQMFVPALLYRGL